MTRRLASLTGRRGARDTGLMLGSQILRVVLLGSYFVLLARSLPVDDFGAFSGVVALVAVLTPFASFGSLNLMIMHISRGDGRPAAHLRTSLLITALSGGLLGLGVLAVAGSVGVPGISSAVVGSVAGSDLIASRLIDVAAGYLQARRKMLLTAMISNTLYAVRLATLATMTFLVAGGKLTVRGWSVAYLLCSVACATVIVTSVVVRAGRSRVLARAYASEWRQGLLFAVSFAAQSIYNDIDKAMLARLSSLDATALYTAAYRLVDMAFAPMRALLSAAYARFFVAGSGGVRGALSLTRKLVPPGLGYCAVASIGLFSAADLVPVVLGGEYASAVGALRGLSLLPLLKACHYLAGDTLTGAGRQGLRTAAQLGVAAVNVGLNAVILPTYSWRGAVVVSLVCDGLLAALLWGLVKVFVARERSAHEPLPWTAVGRP